MSDHEHTSSGAGVPIGSDEWRSFSELTRADVFQARLHNEFPLYAPSEIDGVTRRNFLQVMGATLALAGATAGCARQPEEQIFPYVKQPEDVVPGKPLYFATANPQGGYAKPVLAESHLGRPTKVEGLPGHAASLGRTDAQTQASILDLYDPDRAQSITHLGFVDDWDNFVKEARQVLDDARLRRGAGVRLLTGTVTSPSFAGLIDEFLTAFPEAKWHQYEAAGRENVREGARLAFGEYMDTIYHFDRADIIVSLDADFLERGPANVHDSAGYAARRDVVDHHEGEVSHGETHGLNRLYAFESSPNLVGAAADHRFPVRPSEIEAVARRLASALGVSAPVSDDDGLSEKTRDAIAKVAADLKSHASSSIVIAGEHQPPVVHQLAHAMNAALGGAVTNIPSVEANPTNHVASLRALTDDMRNGAVSMLLIVGTNPVYTAPADIDFLGALKNVPLRAAMGLYLDETAGNCHWHLPQLHYLESWGDARSFDGSVSVIQPLIAPLYRGHTASELVSALLEQEPRAAHDIVMDHWKKQRGEDGFDAFWRQSLADGFIANSAYSISTVSYRGTVGAYAPAARAEGEFEIVFLPDPNIGNGEWTNNAWLMELARPLSKLTWDNAVIVGYGTAQYLGLENEDVVEVTYNGRSVRGPVWVQPGHCPDTITVHLGFGRARAGKVGNDMGFNAYSILNSEAPTIGRGAKITPLASKYGLARTEEHYNMEGRNLARRATVAEFAADPHRILHGEHGEIHSASDEETLYNLEEKQWHGHAWGMTIDLNQCTGCNACIVACQSENIIPVVGKFEVRKGREMAWLRVDRYYRADQAHKFKRLPEATQRELLDNPETYFQPVPCMQCENAPCETVCPVGATQHTREGLNDMVYNRCIGTRYCSNNCPYKVRRFNFYHYSRTPLGSRGAREHALNINWTHVNPETLRLMRNPDVSVRSRGVMEKCTYCVQRINHARIESKRTGEPIQDGAITTACQQACPSGAITFGDTKDPDSAVHKRKQSHRNYGILADLNTRPRTTYLARITNPNPELAGGGETEAHA